MVLTHFLHHLNFGIYGNMYRYEKMQKGRYREFSQFGVEFFGSDNILADVEVIAVGYELFKRLDLLNNITLKINSIGCKECRKKYIEILKEYLKDEIDNMCDDCKRRYDKNPMRIIDCKEEHCKNVNKSIPMITDYLCEKCNTDFENLKEILTEANINYEIDKAIVRGLDYYNGTVFEFESKELNLAVGGGGRYDTLVETLGGPKVPAVGFAIGMDRIMILLKELKEIKIDNNLDVYFTVISKEGFKKVFPLINQLREKGIKSEIDLSGRSFNAQFKYANKLNAKFNIIVGEDELKNNKCVIKNMNTSTQEELNLDSNDIIKYIKK